MPRCNRDAGPALGRRVSGIKIKWSHPPNAPFSHEPGLAANVVALAANHLRSAAAGQ